jgi:hypothetical protein
VIAGTKQVASGPARSDRVRAPGAGPKSLAETQPGLLEALDELVNPETRGNPMSSLSWTSKSTAHWPATWSAKASRCLTTPWGGSSSGWATCCSRRPR